VQVPLRDAQTKTSPGSTETNPRVRDVGSKAAQNGPASARCLTNGWYVAVRRTGRNYHRRSAPATLSPAPSPINSTRFPG